MTAVGVCLNYLLSGEDSAKLRPDHDECSFGSRARGATIEVVEHEQPDRRR